MKSPVEEPVEDHAHAAHGRGLVVGLLYLAQDLGFAHDHGIQGGGHPKQMADRLAIPLQIEVILEIHPVQVAQTGDEGYEIIGHPVVVGLLVGGQDKLHPVAGGDEKALLDPVQLQQPGQGLLGRAVHHGQTLPDLHGRRVVGQSGQQKAHWGCP